MSDNPSISDTIKIAAAAFDLCNAIDEEDRNTAIESQNRLKTMNMAPVSDDSEPQKTKRDYHFRPRRIIDAAFELNDRRFRYVPSHRGSDQNESFHSHFDIQISSTT